MDVYSTDLWKTLEQKAVEEDQSQSATGPIAHEYLAGVKKVCDFGIERSFTIRDTFPLYTKHDETHICNVLRIMWNLLGNDAPNLTRDEAAMLVLAACCHDVGMSYSPADKGDLLEDIDRLNKYLDQHHEEYVKAYATGSGTPVMTDEMMRSYLRTIHPDRAVDLLYALDWPEVLEGRVDVELVAKVCKSHGSDASSLASLEPTITVDALMCAILLRIADILDFDTSRAPQELYDYCGFGQRSDPESIVSKGEWNKHNTCWLTWLLKKFRSESACALVKPMSLLVLSSTPT